MDVIPLAGPTAAPPIIGEHRSMRMVPREVYGRARILHMEVAKHDDAVGRVPAAIFGPLRARWASRRSPVLEQLEQAGHRWHTEMPVFGRLDTIDEFEPKHRALRIAELRVVSFKYKKCGWEGPWYEPGLLVMSMEMTIRKRVAELIPCRNISSRFPCIPLVDSINGHSGMSVMQRCSPI
jgi:hypothetical protein